MTKNSAEAKHVLGPGQDWGAAMSGPCSQLDLVWEGVLWGRLQPSPYLTQDHPLISPKKKKVKVSLSMSDV